MPLTTRPATRGRNNDRPAEQRETRSASRSQRAGARDVNPGGDAENRNPNIIVRLSGLDSYGGGPTFALM